MGLCSGGKVEISMDKEVAYMHHVEQNIDIPESVINTDVCVYSGS